MAYIGYTCVRAEQGIAETGGSDNHMVEFGVWRLDYGQKAKEGKKLWLME